LTRLFEVQAGALSTQVLSEFYAVATKKLGMKSREAEDIIRDLGSWMIHCAGHADVVRAAEIHRRYQVAWWDALAINSAAELGCDTLWTEDLAHGRRYGTVTVRNPFA